MIARLSYAFRTTHAFAGFSLRGAGALLMLVATGILAHRLSAQDFGNFAYAFSGAVLLSQLLSFGLPKAALRSISARESMAKDWMGTMLFTALVATGVSFAVFTLLGLQYPLALACLAGALFLAESMAHMLRGAGHLWWALVPREVIWKSLICLAAIFLDPNSAVFYWLLASTLLALSFAQLAGLGWGRFVLRLWQFEPAYWAASLATTALPSLSVVVVGLLAKGADAGALFVLFKLANLATFPLLALNLMIAPQLAQTTSCALRQSKLHNVQLIILPATLAIIAVVLMTWPWLKSQIANDIAINPYAAAIIIGAVLVHVLSGPTGNLLQMIGRAGLLAKNVIISALLGLTLMALLIPYYGQIGAAIGYAASQVYWNIRSLVQLRRQHHLDPSCLNLLGRGFL